MLRIVKNNKAPHNLEETVTAYGFRNTEKQQDRVQNYEKQKHS
jgi:hypothetical protein